MVAHLKNTFKLVRGGNLIIVFLCMYFFQYFVLKPQFMQIPLIPSVDDTLFFLLTLGVVFITAAGYIINDFFDFETDKEFKADRSVLGVWLSLNNAFNLQLALNLIGLGLCYYVGWQLGNYSLGNYALFCVLLLVIYSMFLKKYFLIGNIVVAALSAFVFVLVVLYEYKFFYSTYINGNEYYFGKVMQQLRAFAFFAFFVSLIREIVKDAEDKEGDRSAGMNTLPIVLSVRMTNLVIGLMILTLMILLGWVQYQFYLDGKMKQFWYIFLFMQLTLSTNLITLFSTSTQADYHNLSVFMKLVILFGVFAMPLFYYFELYG
jgi:4-hydroxybenzoate polyprenyltransferase